ncbi:DUF6461 domain-containing protein [Streptomyces sp. NBC_00391]|uniref:DUF6461 domain-containing protein n=1 Tax=Streptomyces sp. NBC_00391 TaxID=2903647 RepID=UPI002E204941
MSGLPSDSWRWVGGEAWCVTFTHGISPEEVLERYGADPAHAELFDLEEARDFLHDGTALDVSRSALRVGSLGDWSFCYEEGSGVDGAMPEVLSVLSRGTETFSVVLGRTGMNIFEHWSDRQCTELFEPGEPVSRTLSTRRWWDAVQARLEAAGADHPGLGPVIEVIVAYMGVALDDSTVEGPLLTVLMEDVEEPGPRQRSG